MSQHTRAEIHLMRPIPREEILPDIPKHLGTQRKRQQDTLIDPDTLRKSSIL